MAQRCGLCGKGPASGNRVSHSNRKTRRRFMPNIQQLRIVEKGNSISIKSCTRCIRTLSKNPRQKNATRVAVAA